MKKKQNGEEKNISSTPWLNQQKNAAMYMWNLDAVKNYKSGGLNRNPNNTFHMRATHRQNNAFNCCNRKRFFTLIKHFRFVFLLLAFFRIDFVQKNRGEGVYILSVRPFDSARIKHVNMLIWR